MPNTSRTQWRQATAMSKVCRRQCSLCLIMILSLGLLSSVFGEPPRDAAKSGSKFKSELLVDNGRLFFILSDRREKITEFFQRNQVVVGAMWQQDLDKLEKANEPIANIFLDYTSANDDPEKAARYGDYLTLAPLSPGVAEVIEKHAAARKMATGASWSFSAARWAKPINIALSV